jgi:PAS domain S-box-containing protein
MAERTDTKIVYLPANNLKGIFMSVKNINTDLDKVYRLLFETAGEALILVDKEGIIQTINSRTNEMFGYGEQELIGQKMEVLLPEKYRKEHVGHRDSYNKKPRRRSMGMGMELWGRRKDGSQFPLEVSLNHFQANEKIYVMALVTDITQRRIAEDNIRKLNEDLEQRVEDRTHELKESQLLYQAIARNFPDGTINVFDKDLKYVFVEGMELFKYGVTSDVLVGTSYLERLPSEIRNEIKEKLLEVLNGKNASFEVKFRNNFYVMNAVALHSIEGKIDQILLVEQNVTAQKKAQEDMKVALDKEIRLNELKSRFVSMASHEFRTPLSTILTSTTLIDKYLSNNEVNMISLREKSEKHVQRIKSSVGTLIGILDDFLSLDKLEQGIIETKPSLFNIKQFAEDTVDEIHTTLKDGQQINYTHKGNPAEVFIDQKMLKNVLINLLSNAGKYSPEKSVIEFTTSLDKNTLKITIADQGMGIPVADQAQLFERFFRASNATNIQGTGLGLNIVKRYVDIMKGTVNFISKEGKGTTFNIQIPTNIPLS